MKRITILTFNYGNAGRYANGPGMCLINFVKQMKAWDVEVDIYSILKSEHRHVKPLRINCSDLAKSIKSSDIIHHWSGIGPEFVYANKLAQSFENKEVLVGPNVIDTVDFKKEASFLGQIKYNFIFTVNKRLKYQIAKKHKIDPWKIKIMQVGPDTKLWMPNNIDNGKILWKGNSKHLVKNVKFALEVKKRLPQYDFEFIGYPNPYDYRDHIKLAKSCHLYITTSMSETMGLGLAEQWLADIPSITHPKIYLHGENYRTGIITSYNVDSYCESISEIMEDDDLYKSLTPRDYIQFYFHEWRQNYLMEHLS